jgi:poly(A) polymerase
MSFELQGVAFDLLFARLAENIVPKNVNIFDDRILRNLEKESELSLNGPRVTDMIRHLVPKFENFVVVLRCIRKWAKARGIYGNKFGYLGGVNFNILVAFVCQLYPNASPSMLLVRFFRVYSAWKWPSPIMLNRIQPNPPGELRDIWTKEIGAYSGHVMPLITPAYPAANSTANVSEHTLAVMVREFTLGNEVVRGIVSQKANAVWDPLFKPTDFFVAYEQYLCCHIVGSASPEESDDLARSWIGFAESRLRHFPTILGLRLPIAPIHFHPKEFKSPKGHIAVMYFIGFNVNSSKFKPGEEKVLHVDNCVQELK